MGYVGQEGSEEAVLVGWGEDFNLWANTKQCRKPIHNPFRNPSENNGVSVEVKLLREQIECLDTDRIEERNQLKDQIENLRAQIERQSADHRQALAVITDQSATTQEPPRRRFFGLLKG